MSTQHVPPATAHGSLRAYAAGYALAVILTLQAYLVVTHHLLASWGSIVVVILLALTQVVVHMLFFLHVGQESKPRWRLLALGFMVVVVLILVGGSLWIMANLNYNHRRPLTPVQTNNYIQNQDGL